MTAENIIQNIIQGTEKTMQVITGAKEKYGYDFHGFLSQPKSGVNQHNQVPIADIDDATAKALSKALELIAEQKTQQK